MTKQNLEVQKLESWDWHGRPSGNRLSEFKEKIASLNVGETLKDVDPMNIYVFGRPTSFSGGWLGSSNVLSVRKTETTYEIETKNKLWVVKIAAEGLDDRIGVSSSGYSDIVNYNRRMRY